jgi:hypothetical protein
MAIPARRPRATCGTELGLQVVSLTQFAAREGSMFDYQNLKLMHYHGDEVATMSETTSHHDPASHDAEHEMGWYRRVFHCNTCDEEVIVDAKGPEPTKKA